MSEDRDPQKIHRNRRPLEEIQNVPGAPDVRRVVSHATRTLIQPDGSVLSDNQGCRTVPLQDPVNPGIPPTPFANAAASSEANMRVISGNDPMRPSDGQGIRQVH